MPKSTNLRRALTDFALDLDRRGLKSGRSQFGWLTQDSEKVSFTFFVDSETVHNTLNPNRFGAIFTFEGWNHHFSKKKHYIDFILVCPQLKPHLGCTEEMVNIHKISPAIDPDGFAVFEKEFKQYIVKEWNQ